MFCASFIYFLLASFTENTSMQIKMQGKHPVPVPVQYHWNHGEWQTGEPLLHFY